MRRRLFALWKGVALAWALCTLPSVAAEAQPVSAFGPGEQLTYRVHYLGILAGTAEVTVGASTEQWGKQVMPIVTLARSGPLLGFFPIRDKFISYWDPAQERTLGSDLYADENHVRRKQRIQLDHQSGKATVAKQKDGESENVSTKDVPQGSFDIASATFALRNKPLAVGQSYEVPVFTGARAFTLKAQVEGKEEVETPSGKKEAFRIRVQTGFAGKFESKHDMRAWLTTDPTHVPVRIEADFVLGTLKAELSDYHTGTRYTVNAGTLPADSGSGGM